MKRELSTFPRFGAWLAYLAAAKHGCYIGNTFVNWDQEWLRSGLDGKFLLLHQISMGAAAATMVFLAGFFSVVILGGPYENILKKIISSIFQ